MEEFSRELPNLSGDSVRVLKDGVTAKFNGDVFQKAPQSGATVRGEAVAECTLPPEGWYCMRAAGHSGPCAAVAKPIDHEKEVLEVIGQRDKYHDMADQLAAQIAAMTEVEIGEHSSDNEPWRNALIAGDEFIAAKFKAFCNGPVSARAADAPSEPSELLYTAVMNIPCERTMSHFVTLDELRAYKEGHHAARHAAVNLVAAFKSRAADALDSQPTVPDGWQPIETAPKDGTLILLGRAADEENDRGSISTPGRWHESDDDGPDNMGHDAGFMDDEFQQFAWGRSFGNSAYKNGGFQPTHWMPPPPAPASSQPTEPAACGACHGSGRMVRDADIGTDQECFSCDGSGESDEASSQPTDGGVRNG